MVAPVFDDDASRCGTLVISGSGKDSGEGMP